MDKILRELRDFMSVLDSYIEAAQDSSNTWAGTLRSRVDDTIEAIDEVLEEVEEETNE